MLENSSLFREETQNIAPVLYPSKIPSTNMSTAHFLILTNILEQGITLLKTGTNEAWLAQFPQKHSQAYKSERTQSIILYSNINRS